MKFLKELAQIKEAAEQQPVDVIDIVKNFPNKHKEALRALWGKDRLMFKGVSIFGNGGIYDQLDNVIDTAFENGDIMGVAIEMEGDDYQGRSVYMEYTDQSNPTDAGQEVYMGYSPSAGTLFVAYDTSLDEEQFNDEWDRMWARTFGAKNYYDHDDEQQYAVFNSIWKQWRDARPFQVFELDVTNGKLDFVREVDVNNSLVGFYSNGFNQLKAKVADLIDLRLD